jgi:hypothetical protein
MQHHFSVEVAEQYGIEKAVILDNFVFWCQKNFANRKNIHNGKAYTYNTSEALGEIFPYFKPRKIAELLRQMENDNLLKSAYFHGRERVKSYTVTDYGMSFYLLQKNVSCNIQKNDIALSQNSILENTDFQLSSITYNKQTDNKQHIYRADSPETPLQCNEDVTECNEKKKTTSFQKPTVDEVRAYCEERGNNIDPEKFIDYYNSNGWKVGKSPMKDWKATIRNWERNEKERNKPKLSPSMNDPDKLFF